MCYRAAALGFSFISTEQLWQVKSMWLGFFSFQHFVHSVDLEPNPTEQFPISLMDNSFLYLSNFLFCSVGNLFPSFFTSFLATFLSFPFLPSLFIYFLTLLPFLTICYISYGILWIDPYWRYLNLVYVGIFQQIFF